MSAVRSRQDTFFIKSAEDVIIDYAYLNMLYTGKVGDTMKGAQQ